MKKANILEFVSRFGTYMIVIILVGLGCVISDKFLSTTNVINILDAVSYLGILASGMALVTYCGQSVDLSTPSTIAVASFVSILTLRFGMIPMILCTLLSGALIGLFNGLIVGKFRINTVVWTLAVSFVFAGLIRVIFGSANIYVTTGNTRAFEQISRYRIGGRIPLGVVVMVALMIGLHIFVSRKNLRIIDTVQTLRLINRSSDKCDITDRNTAVQSFCDLNDRMFSHSIRYQICTGIQ